MNQQCLINNINQLPIRKFQNNIFNKNHDVFNIDPIRKLEKLFTEDNYYNSSLD